MVAALRPAPTAGGHGEVVLPEVADDPGAADEPDDPDEAAAGDDPDDSDDPDEPDEAPDAAGGAAVLVEPDDRLSVL